MKSSQESIRINGMTRYVYYMDKEALLIFNSAENIIHLLTSVILGDLQPADRS